MAYNIRKLHIDHENWTRNWGPESLWEHEFGYELAAAAWEENGRDKLLSRLERHTIDGRSILTDLKALGSIPTNVHPAVIRDIFLQGYDLVIMTLSEVKFFEVKLDELAPVIPAAKISNICNAKHCKD